MQLDSLWFTHFAGFVPKDIDPRTLPPWPVWSQHKQSLRTGDIVFHHHDSLELVRTFAKPGLLFKGTGSAKFLHDIIDVLANTFPISSIKELPGGHSLHIVSMQSFMNELETFLQEN